MLCINSVIFDSRKRTFPCSSAALQQVRKNYYGCALTWVHMNFEPLGLRVSKASVLDQQRAPIPVLGISLHCASSVTHQEIPSLLPSEATMVTLRRAIVERLRVPTAAGETKRLLIRFANPDSRLCGTPSGEKRQVCGVRVPEFFP